ncbi:MAG: hypothetical protein CFE21_18950 [Bacteroidetes bacterium B1(2017)]|nr:MAG: hypothetical protein CFE21_18950 [Bacteroidetes bacterium B1(2017)]
MNLKDLLTAETFEENGGKPLFDSQAELVRELTKEENGAYHNKDEASLRSYVSQVLKPSDAKNRKFPEEFRKTLSLVLKSKFPGQTNFLEEIEKRIYDVYVNAGSDKNLESSTDELNLTLSGPGVHVMIANFLVETSETSDANKVLEKIMQNLKVYEEVEKLKNLKNNKRNDDNLSSNKYTWNNYQYPSTGEKRLRYRYEYILARKDDAIDLWKSFYKYLIFEKNIDDELVDRVLYELNNKEYIRAFYTKGVPGPALCLHNVYIFNPGDDETRKVFFRISRDKSLDISNKGESYVNNLYKPLRGTLKNDEEGGNLKDPIVIELPYPSIEIKEKRNFKKRD